jgi:hypothetical protein
MSQERLHRNVLPIALANKLARIGGRYGLNSAQLARDPNQGWNSSGPAGDVQRFLRAGPEFTSSATHPTGVSSAGYRFVGSCFYCAA